MLLEVLVEAARPERDIRREMRLLRLRLGRRRFGLAEHREGLVERRVVSHGKWGEGRVIGGDWA